MEEENKKEEFKYEEPKQKSNKVFVIVIVIIAMALTFGCGIILGQKLFEGNKENKNTSKEDKNTVVDNSVLDVNSSEVQKYFNMYKYRGLDDDILLDAIDSNENYRLELSTRLINDEDFYDINCNSINESIVDEENSSCGDVYLKSKWITSSATTKAIKKQIVEKNYKYYFGKNKTVNSNVLYMNLQNMEIAKYYYDSNLDSYVKINLEGGGDGPLLIETIDKAEKNGNDLIITSTLKFEDPTIDSSPSTVILTLTWEDDHYIFKSRVVS